MSEILIIEESTKWRNLFTKFLTPPHDLSFLPKARDIKSILDQKNYEIILLNLKLEKADRFNLLKRIKSITPDTPVIVISETEKTSLIVKTIKEGAFDFLLKPFSKERLLETIRQALENKCLINEIDYLRHEQDIIYDFNQIIAYSPSIKQTIATLKKFSQTDSTILITGETGTGKSFLSGAVHFNSSRRNKPFITINCANIPETLLESELFGHEKGAFTGADKKRVGRLEQGNNGTVFLDEIGELSQALQAKLLRVLEGKSFERIGGNKTIHSDVRIIAATNRNPEQQVAEGKFREDLYYRLNILRLHLPPLRERKECIKPLAYSLLNKICRNLKKKIEEFSPEALEAFQTYSWPGNIREMANTIERAAILEESYLIQTKNIILPEPIKKMAQKILMPPAPIHSLNDQEKDIILKALEESLWIQKDAAKLLGITPRTLNYRIKRLGITHTRWRKNK